jgi:hypothetical protein
MRILTLIIFIFLFSCNTNPKRVLLLYDFYIHGSLKQKNALQIEYNYEKNGIRSATIHSRLDSSKIAYNEIISDSGISRSLGVSNFVLTHSFLHNSIVSSKFSAPKPYFINTLIKNYSTKKFSITVKDSINVVFFDEATPWYTYTDSYYEEESKVFVVFYNPVEDSYFKLSSVTGLNVGSSYWEKLGDKIITDTLFFAKYYKFPETAPPLPVRFP